MTTPADELRAAATKLRELATAATPGPWMHEVSPVQGFRVGTADQKAWVAFTGDYADDPDSSGPDAELIAAMHPGVGLALADWLDYEADLVCVSGAELRGRTQHALAVARQILGTAS